MNKMSGIIFLVIGLLFSGIGIFVLYQDMSTKDQYTTVEGIITDIKTSRDSDGETSYTVYVDYKANGKTYSNYITEWNTFMKIGGNVTVHYKTSEPEVLKHNSTLFLPILFIIMGSVAALVGLSTLIGYNKGKGLKKTGMRIEAEVNDIFINQNVSMNGVHPYQIKFTFHNPSDGQVYTFISKNIYKDLSNLELDKINVYIKENSNPKKHFVDIDDALLSNQNKTI